MRRLNPMPDLRALFSILFFLRLVAGSSTGFYFQSVNPLTGHVIENLFKCCDRQDNSLLALLKQCCSIFNIQDAKNFLTTVSVSTDYGTTQTGGVACTLFYNSRTFDSLEINPCVNKTLFSNVINGLISDCDISNRDISFSVLGLCFGILSILPFCLLAYAFCSRRPRENNSNRDLQLEQAENGESVELLVLIPDQQFEKMSEKLNSLSLPENASEELIKEFDDLQQAFQKFKDRNTCPITYEIINNPVTLDCEHSFEKKDIEKSLKEVASCCPTCKSNVDYPIRLNKVRKNEIDQYLERLSNNLDALEAKLIPSNSLIPA